MDAPTRRIGSVQVIAPQGRVDQNSADELRRVLDAPLAECRTGGTPLVIDFSGVPYISSVGLRVLMLAARQANGQGGQLAVAALKPVVREVFHISRFDLVLKLFDDVDAAAAELGP